MQRPHRAQPARNRKERGGMSDEEYRRLMEQVRRLDAAEMLPLRDGITVPLEKPEDQEPFDIMELEGMGKEVWEGIDAKEYVRRERESWRG